MTSVTYLSEGDNPCLPVHYVFILVVSLLQYLYTFEDIDVPE